MTDNIWEADAVVAIRQAWREEVAFALALAQSLDSADTPPSPGDGRYNQLIQSQGRIDGFRVSLAMLGSAPTRPEINLAMFAPIPDPAVRAARYAMGREEANSG